MHQILEKMSLQVEGRDRQIGRIGRTDRTLVSQTESDGVRIQGGGVKSDVLERWEDFMKRQSLFLCNFAD